MKIGQEKLLKRHLNYDALGVVGSYLLAAFFAVLPTLVIYKIGHSKPELLSAFLPLFVIFARVILWSWEQGRRRDYERRRESYRSGRL